MAPISFRRSGRSNHSEADDEYSSHVADEDHQDVWDPFWEFVLGENGVTSGDTGSRRTFNNGGNIFQKKPEPEQSDSFLTYLFPEDAAAQKGKNKSLKQPTTAVDTAPKRQGSFWRRKQSESVSPGSSWLGGSVEEDRHEASTSRGSGLMRRSSSKTKKEPEDPFGIMKAKDSFDSFMNHYYGSDVETSEEEVFLPQPSQTRQKQRNLLPKIGSDKRRNHEDTTHRPAFLTWEDESKKKKSRRIFGPKEKHDTTVLSSMTSLSPLTSLFSQSNNSKTTVTTKGATTATAATAGSNKSKNLENKSKAAKSTSTEGPNNLSPLDRLVETFDAFGNVATSSEEFSSSNPSNDDDYADDDDEEDESSYEESSNGNASRSTRSYATTEVTNDDVSTVATPIDYSAMQKKAAELKSQRSIQKINQNRRKSNTYNNPLVRSNSQKSLDTTYSLTQQNLNEILLKYTPERPYSQRILSRSNNNMLPPLDHDIGPDDADEGTEMELLSTSLAGESVSTDENCDDDGSDDANEDDDDTEEREDNTTIATFEELTQRETNSLSLEDTNHLPLQMPASCHLPEVLPKSVANSDKTPTDDDSFLVRAKTVLSRNNRSGVGKIACCSLKDLTPEQQEQCRQLGIAVHELTPAELEEIFPKVRSISEEVPLNRSRSHVIGNSKVFEKDFPAHLQAIVNEDGPQSLYEYEYEKRTHKVLVYEKFGQDPRSLLRLHVSEKPPVLFREGLLDENKVIIQVEASTVSQTDCMIREGRWAGISEIPLPNSPGVDVVGRVYSIGKKSVQKFGIDAGQRVMALTQYGGNARYLAVSAGQFVKVPESVDPAEAACLAETYLTAFQALHYGQSVGVRYRKTALKGKQILILGTVTTNMGRALSQLSSAAAVDNLYATSKQKHYQRLTSLGILPLSMDPLHWFERLKGKIDLIISFGEEITPLHFKILTSFGEALLITNDGSDPTIEIGPILRSHGAFSCVRRNEWQNKSRLNCYNVFNEWDNNLQKCKRDLEHLLRLLDERWVSPEVLDRIPLHKVARAQELINAKNIPGFIVCEPWIISKSRAVLL